MSDRYMYLQHKIYYLEKQMEQGDQDAEEQLEEARAEIKRIRERSMIDTLAYFKNMDDEINSRIEYLDAIRCQMYALTGVDYSVERVQSSRKSNDASFVDLIEKYEEVVKDISKEVQSMEAARKKIIQKIEKLEDPSERSVLLYRYINGMKVPEIAEKMNYSTRQIYNIHDRAISNLTYPKKKTS